MMPTRVRLLTATLAALAIFAGCGEPAPLSGGGPAMPAKPAPETLYLVDVSLAAGFDRLHQSVGDPDVDYIIDSLGVGAAWLDYDRDGDPDLYLAQGAHEDDRMAGPPDQLLRNDGDPDGDGVPVFTDVTAESGLGDRLRSFGVAVADFDNDRDPDIYLANWGPNRLYRNDGNGRFSEIAAPSGVADESWSVSAAWSDVDRDGDLDLYVTNYVDFDFERYPARGETPGRGEPPCVWKGIEIFCGPRNLEPAPDRFFRNDGDPDGDGIPTFTEATRQVGLAAGQHLFALAVQFFDADGDGDDDLYVANDSVQNTYFVNRGDGTFAEVSSLAGLAYNEQGMEQAGMGIASGDYDGDGRLDLYVTNFSHDHDTLYRNEGQELFIDVSYPAGVGTASFLTLGWGAAFLDLDLDGWEDVFVAHGHIYPQIDDAGLGSEFRQRNGLFRNAGNGSFEQFEERAGSGLAPIKSSRSVVPVDLEGDGDIDLLVTNFNDSPDLLRNDGATGNWLQVRLEGTTSNRDGIGARVTLTAGGRSQIREIRRNSHYAASTLPIAYFGLGDARSVELLEVRWPSGRVSTKRQLEPNHLLTIREPDE